MEEGEKVSKIEKTWRRNYYLDILLCLLVSVPILRISYMAHEIWSMDKLIIESMFGFFSLQLFIIIYSLGFFLAFICFLAARIKSGVKATRRQPKRGFGKFLR